MTTGLEADIERIVDAWLGHVWPCTCTVMDGYNHREDCPAQKLDSDEVYLLVDDLVEYLQRILAPPI